MARAAEIVTLRALGLSLAQIARVLGDDPQSLESALAAHQVTLEVRIRQLAGTVEKVRDLRAGLARGKSPTAGELARVLGLAAEFNVAFRSSMALGWRTVRTTRRTAVELYHWSVGQRQNTIGQALG
jgi:DNA-binding transcriptional MerR regulator